MNGWDRVKQLQSEYNQGFTIGSAQRENEIYLDSIAGKWNTLKETMKGMVTGSVSSDFIKGFLDGITKAVQAVDTLTSKLGTIGTIGAIGGIASFIKGFAGFDNIVTGVNKLGQSTVVMEGFAKVFLTLKNAIASGGGIKGALTGLVAGFKGLTTGVGIAKVAMIAFNAVCTGLAITAVIAGITMAVKAWDNYAHATEKAINASKDRQANIQSTIQGLNTEKSGLVSIAQEYDTLASKTKKTAEEMARFKELKQQIAQTSPDLVAGYDSNNDPILKLSGSLTQYINDLDKAINKQQKLFNAETSQQADTYALDNDKGGSDDYLDLRNAKLLDSQNKVNSAYIAQEQSVLKDILGMNASNAKEIAEARIRYREQHQKAELESSKKFNELRSQQMEKDMAQQSKAMNKFLDNVDKGMSENAKGQFTNFMASLDWGTLGTAQANQMTTGMQKLAEVTAFTTGEMGKFAQDTGRAFEKFENTGAINAYGKELQKIGEVSGKFDIQSWSGYLDEVNTRFAEGSLSAEQYEYSLGIMAQTMSDMTNIPYDTVLQSLVQTGDVQSALDSATQGLNNFMKAYGKTATNLRSGDDSVANLLAEQYDSIVTFGQTLEQKAISNEITVEWLLANKGDDLPKQMNDMIDLVTADNNVTEIEKELLLNVQAEIQNEGKLKDDTVKKLEGLFDGSIDISKGLEIAGLELSATEAKHLQEQLRLAKEAGVDLGNMDLSSTGIEELVNDAKEVQKALDSIKDKEIKFAIQSEGNFLDTKKEIDLMNEAIGQFEDKETKLDFIADTAKFFDGANSVEEAINSLPPELKLKYNVGVEGDAELKELQSVYKALPESIQTRVNGEVFGIEDVQRLTELVEMFGEKNATALLNVEGAEDAFNKCSTVEQFLEEISNLVAKGQIEITANTEEVDQANEALNEIDGKEVESTATLKIDEGLYNEVTKKLDELQKKKVEPEIKPKADTTNLEKTEEKIEKISKPTDTTHTQNVEDSSLDNHLEKKEKAKENTESNHKAKADSTELEKTEEKHNDLNGKQTTSTHTGKSVDEEIDEVIRKQKEASRNTQSTHTATSNDSSLDETVKKQKEASKNTQSTHTAKSVDEEMDEVVEKQKKASKNTQSTHTANADTSELDEANKKIESQKDTQINITFNVNDAIDSVLSRLGLNKKKETIDITINAIDNASPTLDKINNFQSKTVTFTIQANGGAEASQQVQTIASTAIPDKTFNITCNSGTVASQVDAIASRTISDKTFSISCNSGTVASQIDSIAGRAIPNKTFSVTCNSGTVLTQLNSIAGRALPNKKFSISCNAGAVTSQVQRVNSAKVANKSFTINCNDQASSKINSINGKKISNKSFTVSCKDNASGVLNSIRSKLNSIKGKTVTVTARYATSGKKPAGLSSVNQPQIITMQQPVVKTQDISQDISQMVSTQATNYYSPNVDYNSVMSSLDYSIDLMKSYAEALNKLNAQLDINSAKQEQAFGNHRATLLNEQIGLLKQQQALLHDQNESLRQSSSHLKNFLNGKGFAFDSEGNITNMQKRLVELEKQLEKTKKAQDDYKGKDEGTKNSLAKAYEDTSKEIEKVKKALDEYSDATSSQIPQNSAEWWDLQNAIRECENAITEAHQEQIKFFNELKTQQLEHAYDGLSNQMDILNSKINLADDQTKIGLYNEQIALLKEQQNQQHIIAENMREQLRLQLQWLNNKGFMFDDSGNILNGANRLNQLKDASNYEAIKEAYDNYLKLQNSIGDCSAEWWSLQESIKEAGDSIQDIYDAQEEARKRAEEEARKRQEELERQREEARKEMLDLQKMTREARLSQLEAQYESIISLLDYYVEKTNNAFGVNKYQYMEEQIYYLERQKNALSNLSSEYERQTSTLRGQLRQWGVVFDAMGNPANYGSIMGSMVDKDKADELQDLMDEYLGVSKELQDVGKEWEEINGQIQEVKDSMLELHKEIEELKNTAWLDQYQAKIDKIQSQLDRNEGLSDLNGSNLNKLLEERLSLYKQLQIRTEDMLDYQGDRMNELKDALKDYHFEFDTEGNITNMAKQLEGLKSTLSETQFDYMKDMLDEYVELNANGVAELENQLLEYEKAYQDTLKEKLELTKDIEDKITEMYEKEIEERIEAIEKERDAQIESLEKQKDAYNKWRDEVDYANDYDEQLKKVEELQKKLDIARRDESLIGQKRVEELMAELVEEQKTLEELVESKIDDDINNMFDGQIGRIETDADEEIKKIEELFSETKIAEMVQNAISTGLFTSIDGEITSLESALMDFANSSVEYLGVMGNTLKTELLQNLNVALDTMQQLNEINDKLGNIGGAVNIPVIPKGIDLSYKDMGVVAQGSNSIEVGDIILTIEGNVDSATIEQMKTMLEQSRKQIVDDIMKNTK